MFTPDFRDHVRERLIEIAKSDRRIESGAAVGGSAGGERDRWSDIDLTFGVTKDASLNEVLVDWTKNVRDEFAGVTLFDLPFRSSMYRVFLLPGSLQVDLSFTPGSEFGAHTPRFELLFGNATKKEQVQPPPAGHEFGLATHHAVRAQLSIERGRLWQAEYWVSAVRDHALTLACLRLGLPPEYGRGFDRLPESIRGLAEKALVRSLEANELKRALRAGVELLLSESQDVHDDAVRIDAMLRELVE